MPNLVNFSNSYNKKLYDALIKLFDGWGKDVSEPENLAMLIAHQSALETEIRQKKIHQGSNVTKRKGSVDLYLAALRKARMQWLKMENDDQISLSRCIKRMDEGHEIMEVLEPDQIHTGYKPKDSMATWRAHTLSKHMFWGIDTEMLDLLIGAAQIWLKEDSPKQHEKIDPTLYAVIYMGGHCENHNISAAPSESSRFTKIVSTYFDFTEFPSKKNKERLYFKDLINKANDIRKRDYADHFLPFDKSWFEQ